MHLSSLVASLSTIFDNSSIRALSFLLVMIALFKNPLRIASCSPQEERIVLLNCVHAFSVLTSVVLASVCFWRELPTRPGQQQADLFTNK